MHRNGDLICQAEIAGALQKVLAMSLRISVLYSFHYLVFAGHSDERQLYNTMRREYYRLHISNDGCSTVPHCLFCTGQGKTATYLKQVRLFRAAEPPEH